MLAHKSCEAFLAVAEYGSFEAAATQLCITASAVSLRVQTLEKQLGQIFIVRERPCRVTHAGEILLKHLQHQRLKENQLLQQLQGHHRHAFYQLNIATNADTLATWLLPILQPILIQKKITLNLMIEDQSQTHELLANGLVNACISEVPQTMKGCHAHLLGNMRYKMVATPQFRQDWFDQGIHRQSIRQAPAVIFNHKDQLHEKMTLSLFGLNQHDYPHHFIPSSTAFVEAIELSLGFGMVPEIQIQQQLHTGQLIELLPEARKDQYLYWHHWEQQSTALHAISQQMITQTQQLLIYNE